MGHSHNKPSGCVKVAHVLDDYGDHILGAVADVAFATFGVLAGLFKAKPLWYFLAITGICVIVCRIWSARRTAKCHSIVAENEELQSELQSMRGDSRNLIRNRLSKLSSMLGYSNTERISAYKHDGSAFVLIGRYSINPDYDKPGRSYYPDYEGCIGKAWREGTACVNNLPDPDKNIHKYVEKLKAYGIDIVTIYGLTMRSRNLIGYAVVDSATDKRFAVLVFESTLTNKVDKNQVLSIINSSEGKDLIEYLQRSRLHLPTPSKASKEGF